MTQTKTASAAAKSSAKGGLKPELNPTIGAPIHKDLYEVPADQEALKQEKIKQTRILGLGFFVVFFLIIGGLSMTLNGAWKKGLAVSMPLRRQGVPPPSLSPQPLCAPLPLRMRVHACRASRTAHVCTRV